MVGRVDRAAEEYSLEKRETFEGAREKVDGRRFKKREANQSTRRATGGKRGRG